jgi:hypothetical protein
MDGYPKSKYFLHGGGSVTVDTPEQEKQLGPEWTDAPMFFAKPDVPKPVHKKHKEAPIEAA